ncbi:zinc finger CCCH domain-containing protein 11-like [Iris pallida]|uniref:Zinc finger CCCH domain-containing protein 11-like n=1 Tax=Iris pallida TaxID=29817 RepID=A0AAX6E3T0_IRIPA|nr:zinc finger CCCH domain-containing protein 11-like [Iris pallida]
MPPKQSKADLAKKQKVVEDKTFGLKNKNKSKNVQKYVQNIQQSALPKPDASKAAAKKKKEEEKAKEKELNDLFKIAVSQPKVPAGVDPKSVLCEFFKVGQCAKGFKCKFSHDLNVQRKGRRSTSTATSAMILWRIGIKRHWRRSLNRRRQSIITRTSPPRLFVSTSWMQWKRNSTAGSGFVPMVIKSATIGMLYPLDMS